MTTILRRLDGYRRRAVYEWKQWRVRKQNDRCQQAVQSWISQLRSSPPNVLVGANFAEFGGVRGHIQAIQRHSKLDIQLVPPDKLIRQIGIYSFTEALRSTSIDFLTKTTKIAHSHVFPWFIEWCYNHKQADKIRWIHTHHNWYYPEFGKGALEAWQEEFNDGFLFALRNADVSLSVSRWQQKYLKDTFGLETQYLPNGVDVRACEQANANRWIAKHGQRDFVLYIGRNDPVKNPVDFVLLAQAMPETQFVMLGQGLSSDVLKHEWHILAPQNLTVLGSVSHSDAQNAIAACRVLVITSKREGLPTLALEAMAQRKPVVVPTEDGCMEAVADGEFGFVYGQGDIAHLTEMTMQAIGGDRRCAAAREHVLQHYDWSVVMRKLDHIYEDACA